MSDVNFTTSELESIAGVLGVLISGAEPVDTETYIFHNQPGGCSFEEMMSLQNAFERIKRRQP